MDNHIETALNELEGTDIKRIGEEKALEKASNIKRLLNQKKIPKNDPYRRRVNQFVSTVRASFELAGQDTTLTVDDFLHHGRKYAGNLNNYRVIALPSHIRHFQSKSCNFHSNMLICNVLSIFFCMLVIELMCLIASFLPAILV